MHIDGFCNKLIFTTKTRKFIDKHNFFKTIINKLIHHYRSLIDIADDIKANAMSKFNQL